MIAICGECGARVIQNSTAGYVHADIGDATAHILFYGTTITACEECPQCGILAPVGRGTPFCSYDCETTWEENYARYVCEDYCQAIADGKPCTCPNPTVGTLLAGYRVFILRLAKENTANGYAPGWHGTETTISGTVVHTDAVSAYPELPETENGK
jgi:hypothetical protein